MMKKTKVGTYVSLIGAMIAGRIVWGRACVVIYGLMDAVYSWQIFTAAAFFQAIPGIILQLVAIPPIVMLLRKTSLMEQ